MPESTIEIKELTPCKECSSTEFEVTPLTGILLDEESIRCTNCGEVTINLL